MADHATPQAAVALPPPEGAVLREKAVPLWPVILVIYAAMLPREVRLDIGSLTFFADRIALLATLPFIVRRIMAGEMRPVIGDSLVLAGGLWMIAVMIGHYGIAAGLERGGSVALDSTIGYYLARVSFRSLQDVRRFLILISPGLFIAGLTVAAESITHRPIVQPIARALFGELPAYISGEVVGVRRYRELFRLGLMRGAGPFAHPIHAGLFLAVCAPLYLTSGIRGWPRRLGDIASLLSVFSVSSAALLALLLGYALVALDKVQRHVRELSWTLMIGAGCAVLLTVQYVSNSGVPSLIVRYLTLDSGTAYFRQLIWRYGTATVSKHPLTGIGVADYERPSWMVAGSVDAHWLLLAIQYGLFPAVALLLTTLLALIAMSRASVSLPPLDRRFSRGIAISLFVMALSMFSVALWGGLLSWFNILLGMCVTCAQFPRTQR